MKRNFGIIVMITMVVLIGTFFIPGIIDQNQSRTAAKSVLDNVIDENYAKAFDNVYFWDVSSDVEPTIKYEDAKYKWIKRVIDLKENGTYIIDYSSLRIRLEDTYPVGTVDLIVMENGEKVLKKDIRLWFAPKDGSWKLGNLYTNDQEELLKALSGSMR